MKISDYYKKNKYTFSFEFFPPKNDTGEKKLFEAVRELKILSPSFISVTYGAMGTTRNNTIGLVKRIKSDIGIESAAHLSCIAHTKQEIEAILAELVSDGIENIVALRGDIPQDQPDFKSPENGFRYAADLVRYIRQHPKYGNQFTIAVAGHPECHIECTDKEKDLEHLRMKVAEGADIVITQLFFSNHDYFDFVSRCRAVGISLPIVPGIMPITNGAQIQKFTRVCGAKLPAKIQNAIFRYGDDQASIEAFGTDYAITQCEELLRKGAPGLHFYTLNKSTATRKIFRSLNLSGV
ncbi:MAG: methylenetetrahydrofolate reductase [NAD(P)H] [Omnitrophica bacterium RIFCSPLOWO2_12_FULL_44_17]|uniref:Methylenetetrahydrofolate reductase n=1 Tax=Candidatus Danuiimicrobium aquiferis TaxID=1801832 RepID=A0A1G1L202_9BACT|nr:MAG: methylenetetrahydrofolate reductase [NAD(P)H] [Omnitrophica bacterium RIFCSPHIGHO2_02_FULL_45_28]OGW91293.1 MAG: methylenetetrahydrofolate reductase [NAD(P)H] [Omnitrophica bacterium RIFCSPHIGHO2_12_FULL_44_12]OGW99175.1 MAG: methylenetetrahydrofolate reductase [NAD(P)H] [Omnitrophica bacterium RIFCSPLOWO2_12_FULL_44_17]OGX04409.1 MAG: methylenetetrahydrofolate reductase [NAD(P)H] [Omnitrophica bacterium RIFCSPLOWO2_02_FULL_44_11]